MFIEAIVISNFRVFKSFEMKDINIPDDKTEGSGLTVLVGENGTGKSALLEAFALALIPSKGRGFGINNFNDKEKFIEIHAFSRDEFEINPQGAESFCGKGFFFGAGMDQGRKAAHAHKFADEALGQISGQIRCYPGFIRSNNELVNMEDMLIQYDNTITLFFNRDRFSDIVSGNYRAGDVGVSIADLSNQFLNNMGINAFHLSDGFKNQVMKMDVVDDALKQAILEFQQLLNPELLNMFTDPSCAVKTAYALLSGKADEINMGVHGFTADFRAPREFYLHFSIDDDRGHTIPISANNLGAGYSMIFPLLYFIHLAKRSGRKVIILIDEPEIHLHPKMQHAFAVLLLRHSVTMQIIITTHSPLLVKQLQQNGSLKDKHVKILKKDQKGVVLEVQKKKEKPVLSYTSANEVSYIAFNLVTEEYHRELYERLILNYLSYLQKNPDADKRAKANEKNINQKDFDAFFFGEIGERENMKQNRYKPAWSDKDKEDVSDDSEKDCPGKVTLHTYVRNQIHHSASYRPINPAELEESIKVMREFFDFPEGANPPE